VTTPDNPATALHSLLRSVTGGGNTTFRQRWEAILGAQAGTREFAQRHSEVVGLWRQVHDLLEGIPEGDVEREQYLQYMGHYYNVIIHPGNWGEAASSVGQPTLIDHLTGIATTLRYRGLASPPVGEEAIDRLRASIEEWRGILREADFEESFATELRAQVNHLEWLLGSTELLGARPVVEASKKLVGCGVVAMGTKPSFAKRIGNAIAPALVVIALFHTVADDLIGIAEGMVDLRDAVVKIVTPPKQLEAPKTKQLPAGKSDDDPLGDTPDSPEPDEGAQG
jgi:hypothetical protein